MNEYIIHSIDGVYVYMYMFTVYFSYPLHSPTNGKFVYIWMVNYNNKAHRAKHRSNLCKYICTHHTCAYTIWECNRLKSAI